MKEDSLNCKNYKFYLKNKDTRGYKCFPQFCLICKEDHCFAEKWEWDIIEYSETIPKMEKINKHDEKSKNTIIKRLNSLKIPIDLIHDILISSKNLYSWSNRRINLYNNFAKNEHKIIQEKIGKRKSIKDADSLRKDIEFIINNSKYIQKTKKPSKQPYKLFFDEFKPTIKLVKTLKFNELLITIQDKNGDDPWDAEIFNGDKYIKVQCKNLQTRIDGMVNDFKVEALKKGKAVPNAVNNVKDLKKDIDEDNKIKGDAFSHKKNISDIQGTFDRKCPKQRKI